MVQEETYRGMWERATDEILEKLVGVSPGGLTFVGQRRHIGKLIGAHLTALHSIDSMHRALVGADEANLSQTIY